MHIRKQYLNNGVLRTVVGITHTDGSEEELLVDPQDYPKGLIDVRLDIHFAQSDRGIQNARLALQKALDDLDKDIGRSNIKLL